MADRNINLNINLQARKLAELKQAFSPTTIRAAIHYENELKTVRQEIAAAAEKERLIQGEVVERATTAAERRIAGIRAVNEGLERQRQAMAKVRAALEPDKVRETVRLQNEMKAAQLNLNAALEKERRLQGEVVEKAVTGEERYLAALHKVNEALDQQQQKLVDLGVASQPKVIKQSVANQLKIEERQRSLTFAENKERTRQLGPLRGFLDLLNIGDLSGKLAGMGGKMAGMGDVLSGAAKKAGGGLLGGLFKGAGGMLSKAGAALAIPGLGPIAAAAAVAIPLVAKAVRGLASAPFKLIAGGLGSVNNALKGLLGPLGPIGSLLGGATSALDSFADKTKLISPLLSGIAEGISAVLKQVGDFLQVSIQLAAKAKPGAVKRLQLAIDDTAAVIGHRLVPVVDLMRDVIRGIGDFLHTMLPNVSEFRAALQPLREAFMELKQELAPVAKILKVELIAGLKLFAAQMKTIIFLSKLFVNIVPGVGALFKLAEKAFGSDLQSSVGAAAQQVSFTTPESYTKEVYAAAAGSGASPEERTAQSASGMLEVLSEIRDWLFNGGWKQDAVATGAGAASVAIPGAGAVAAAARSGFFGWPGTAPGSVAAGVVGGGVGAVAGLMRR